MLTFANVIWGARCGKSARRVLLGETRTSDHAHSVRGARESAALRQAPHGLPSSRLVSTIPLDRWLAANYPQVPFERYADDVIAHSRTEKQAQEIRRAIAERLRACGLELHPEKTKIVYCKDDFRKSTYPNEKFDFLGYTFQPRRSKIARGSSSLISVRGSRISQ
jgi:Reverse transcriptase (RNA-dependent DNA polymerase)